MDRHDLRLLAKITGDPCVTITLPTHRTSPENRQDPLRVKDMVEQAGTRLLAGFSKREIAPLLANLEKLLDRAVGERKSASNIDEVWLLANEGQGQILLVEQDFHLVERRIHYGFQR